MGWLVMGSVGALLGGLFLCFKNLFPYLLPPREAA